MKVSLLIACAACAVLATNRIVGAAVQAPLDLITLEDLTDEDRKQLEYINSHYGRPKRSGDIFSHIKASIGQGIKTKLGQIARASASASAHFSSGSSGHSYHDVPETYEHKSFDFWALKKSILNTLLQAVKAIKGGVIAIKGQLIKGGGHLISAKGKLISAKGEAITNLGKNIAATAILSPHHGHSPSGHGAIEYGPPHYDHSAPEIYHEAPSSSGPEFSSPGHIHSSHHEDKLPSGVQAGILILKKIPNGRHIDHSHHGEESKVPEFKPLKPSGPSFGTIFSKFFAASSSLNPKEPKPFGDTGTGYDSSSFEALHHKVEPHFEHDTESHHSPSHHDIKTTVSSHESYIGTEFIEPRKPEFLKDTPPAPTYGAPFGGNFAEPPSTDFVESDQRPPSTNYGSPFEDVPSYLNADEYSSESKKIPKTIKPSSASKIPLLPVLEPTKQLATSSSSNYQSSTIVEPQPTSLTSTSLTGSGYLENSYEKPSLFVAQPTHLSQNDLPNIESFPPYPGQLPQDFLTKYGKPIDNQSSYSHLSPLTRPTSKIPFYPTPLASFKNPSFGHLPSTFGGPTSVSLSNIPSSPSGFKLNSYFNAPPTKQIPVYTRLGRFTRTKMPPPGFDVVRSISFELGPNGPKRI